MSREDYPVLKLAERRKKEKWSLNPRGSQWSSDDNKFGQRLLEKMGWKKGSGLGVNLQGTATPVRLSIKNDKRGLGLKGRREDLLEHQSTFNKLLEELNGGVKEEVSVSSLEQQSQQSRARVHYRKFIRGKDLSRCSAKDLQCILGKNVNKKEEAIDSFYERKVQDSVILKPRKNDTSSMFETGESDELVIGNKVSSPATDSGNSTNETDNSLRKLKNKVRDFVVQVSECENEHQSENFVTNFDIENNEESRVSEMEMYVDLINNEEEVKSKKHVHKRKYKKQSVHETIHVEDDLRVAKVKKKRRKYKTCELSMSQEDDKVSVIGFEESCYVEDITLPTCDIKLTSSLNGPEQCDAEATNKYKKKSRKEKLKSLEKCSDLCEVQDKLCFKKVKTGIRKRTAVTDLGFKGSNIMCIKGYGVTLN